MTSIHLIYPKASKLKNFLSSYLEFYSEHSSYSSEYPSCLEHVTLRDIFELWNA